MILWRYLVEKRTNLLKDCHCLTVFEKLDLKMKMLVQEPAQNLQNWTKNQIEMVIGPIYKEETRDKTLKNTRFSF